MYRFQKAADDDDDDGDHEMDEIDEKDGDDDYVLDEVNEIFEKSKNDPVSFMFTQNTLI